MSPFVIKAINLGLRARFMDVDVEESALKRNNTFRQYLRHAIPLHIP